MNERRKDKRAIVDLPITVKIGKRQLAGTTLNVSFHGLSVKLSETPPIRQLVNIDLNLPSGKPFAAHAMVVHGNDGAVGLEFFGRTSHPEWDEFVQTALRSPTNPSAVAVTTNPNAAAVTTNPKVSIPPLPMPSPGTPARAPSAAPGPSTSSPAMPAVSTPPPAGPIGPPPQPAPAPPYQGPERRRAPRIQMQLELRLRTPRSIHIASTVDVSMTGATIAVAELQAQVGEPVIVNLIQPGTSFSFRRDGVLRRVTAIEGPWAHAGVEFTPLDPAREVLFAEFMNTAYAHFNGPPA